MMPRNILSTRIDIIISYKSEYRRRTILYGCTKWTNTPMNIRIERAPKLSEASQLVVQIYIPHPNYSPRNPNEQGSKQVCQIRKNCEYEYDN